MKRLFNLIAFVVVLLLASCSGESTVQGYIVGKRHNPARRYCHYDPGTHTNRIRYIPEAWILYVADSTAVRTVHVDKPTFDSAVKGETIRLHCGKESE